MICTTGKCGCSECRNFFCNYNFIFLTTVRNCPAIWHCQVVIFLSEVLLIAAPIILWSVPQWPQSCLTVSCKSQERTKKVKHIFLMKGKLLQGNACWRWHSFLCRAGMLDFWKGLIAWNFLWAECLKKFKLEWQIRQNHSPHVEKSADAFKHMTYEMTQLEFFLSSVSGYYWEHWRCGFASCYVSLKSSWK